MAMTKKEKEALEAALTAAALRTTSDVVPDIPPPTCGGLSKGFAVVGARSDYGRVEPACSSSVHHGIGQQDKLNSRDALHLYSTKMLALKALRRAVERDCADRLRRVDRMIEAEISSEGNDDGTATQGVCRGFVQR
jgi:hypothetical protein